MSFISKTVFRPIAGKSAVAQERVKRLAAGVARAGGRTRVANVLMGEGAPEIHLYGSFETMEAYGKASIAMYADADFKAVRAEAEKEPASHWEGPEVWRTVFGGPQLNFPVMLQREYDIDRPQLKNALALLPEVQALRPDRPVIGVVPVIADDMARLMIGYYANSLADLGDMIDRVGMSDAFQAITMRAAEFGTLMRARVLVNI